MCETDGEAVVGCEAAASAFYLILHQDCVLLHHTTLFLIQDLTVIFLGFPSFSELFVSIREIQTEN